VSSPFFLMGTFPQAFAGWWFGDRTDEGIDARTTYHLLAAMFSLPIFWPLLSIIWTGLSILYIGIEPIQSPIIFLVLLISFYLSAVTTAFGYDLIQDFLRNRRRVSLANSDLSKILYDSVKRIDFLLVDLI
ncbi:MAG: hypothetical protein ACPGQG_02910, partial [Candidatus Thalassarchaeaceae archaeon]